MTARYAEPSAAAWLAALLAAALAAGPAAARTSDRNKPMEIEADHADATLSADGTATLTDNVRIMQGTLLIEADRAVVTRRNGAVSKAVLEGTPATLQQEKDEGGLTRAKARRIEYDLAGDALILTGGVEVSEPQGLLSGERIVYDLTSGQLRAGGEGGRIRMRIEPNPNGAASEAR